MTSPVVLDASALLAWMRAEPGFERVAPRLVGAAVATPNWSEVHQKLEQRGVEAARVLSRVVALGVAPEPFTTEDAVTAAGFWSSTRANGLSLGDRCCLALGARLARPVLTADRAWAALDVGVTVEVIR